MEETRSSQDVHAYAYGYPSHLCFYVDGDWDVYTNMGTLEPWWRLGNLREEPLGRVLRRWVDDDLPILRTMRSVSRRELSERHGDPLGERVYSGLDDLLSLYLARECEACVR